MGRKFVVGANWKCNGTLTSVEDLLETVYSKLDWDTDLGEVFVAPSTLHLLRVSDLLSGNLQAAAQNCSSNGFGAFTGEVAAEQLRDAKVNWVIVGHSERRARFGDTDEVVAGKIRHLQELNMNAILCVGEDLLERENELTMDVVIKQLTTASKAITNWEKVVVAYEPVWAIGTGRVASVVQVQEVHKEIRKWVRKFASSEVADSLRVIYGGSVTADNCTELIAQEDIDGFLVGGASLKPGFSRIVQACEAKKRKCHSVDSSASLSS